MLAIYALGASAPVIDAAYQTHVAYQQPTVASPGVITTENFNDHLGQEAYYSAYVTFFAEVLRKNGAAATLEKYVFSQEANVDVARDTYGKPQSKFLSRLIDGIFHPMIHVGYGLEFGLPGTLAEGLAQAAIHENNSAAIIPESLFQATQSSFDTAVARITSLVPSLTLTTVAKPASPPGTHVFTIMARILEDPNLKIKRPDAMTLGLYDRVSETHGDLIRKYAEQWTLDTSDPQDLARKIEELIWMNTIIFGVGGWSNADGFKADFFFMHMVTSSIFLPSIVAYLRPESQNALLRAYLASSLVWWVTRGLPSLDIPGFFASAFSSPPDNTPHHPPDDSTLPSPTSIHALTPNPWLPIIQTTVVHPDEHLCKLQRALAHFAVLYGSRDAGQADFKDTELEGADKLDGTLFVRTAAATAKKMGWMREGEKAGAWDRVGFYRV